MVSRELLLKLFFKILCKAHYYREKMHRKKGFGKGMEDLLLFILWSCRLERVPGHVWTHSYTHG